MTALQQTVCWSCSSTSAYELSAGEPEVSPLKHRYHGCRFGAGGWSGTLWLRDRFVYQFRELFVFLEGSNLMPMILKRFLDTNATTIECGFRRRPFYLNTAPNGDGMRTADGTSPDLLLFHRYRRQLILVWCCGSDLQLEQPGRFFFGCQLKVQIWITLSLIRQLFNVVLTQKYYGAGVYAVWW